MDRKGVSEKMIVSHRLILSLLYMPAEYNICCQLRHHTAAVVCCLYTFGLGRIETFIALGVVNSYDVHKKSGQPAS